MPRLLAWLVASALLSACSSTVNKVDVDAGRLVAGKPIGSLSCAYRLAELNDARPSGDRAGGLGVNMMLLSDPKQLIRNEFTKAGMLSPEVAEGRAVTINVKQVYLSQNLTTKIPVVVYEVRVHGQEPFIVRGQPASMNWNGTENEAYGALAKAFQVANSQVVSGLNERCGI